MRDNTYTVVSGDTLYGISKQFNTSSQTIRELNNLTSDNLTIGQVLIIENNNISNPSECVTYTVKENDNLYSIAKKYDTTVDKIKEYNNLDTNNLTINQKLKIPCYKPTTKDYKDYITYTVKSGDNLYDIAKKYNTQVDTIKEDNNLDTNNLTIGQVLIIKDNVVKECYGTDSGTVFLTYTVKSGDNLYDIANTYNTTVDEIKLINNLTSNNLTINQDLIIPISDNNNYTNYIIYTVQANDSLYSIANKLDVLIEDIKALNNLTNNDLVIGQKLKIPALKLANDITYVVMPNDSLYSIANKFNTSIDSIKTKNNLTSNTLSVGQILKIGD